MNDTINAICNKITTTHICNCTLKSVKLKFIADIEASI